MHMEVVVCQAEYLKVTWLIRLVVVSLTREIWWIFDSFKTAQQWSVFCNFFITLLLQRALIRNSPPIGAALTIDTPFEASLSVWWLCCSSTFKKTSSKFYNTNSQHKHHNNNINLQLHYKLWWASLVEIVLVVYLISLDRPILGCDW